MVPSNLKVLPKIGLCSNCSQKIDACSLARARKTFATARMLGISIKKSLSCSVNICILETIADTGNNVYRIGNWETLGKNARAMNVSGKMLPRFVNVYWNWPARVHSQVSKSRVTRPWNISLVKAGLGGNLLACEQGLRKLQIPFSVRPLTRVKLIEVILQKTVYKYGIIGCKLLRMIGSSCFESVSQITWRKNNGKFTMCSLLAYCNFKSAHIRKLITAHARKNKRTACMLANARKDHSIPLKLNHS